VSKAAGPSKRTLEIALASVERDIAMVIEGGPSWRELIVEVTAAAELQEAIERLEKAS
jgi:hypothetical protein